MKRLACLVVLVLALPCSAAGPRTDHTRSQPPRPQPAVAWPPNKPAPVRPERLLSDRRLRVALRPHRAIAEEVLERTGAMAVIRMYRLERLLAEAEHIRTAREKFRRLGIVRP